MSIFAIYKKILIFLLILSFSIFFKGCSSDSKTTIYQVGFPLKVFDIILNGTLGIISENSLLLNLIFNISIFILITLLGLFVYRRISNNLQSKVSVFFYLFTSHILVHNGSLFIDLLTRFYNGSIFLAIIFFPVIIINFLYVDFPLVLLNLLLTGTRNQISDHTLRLSFIIIGLLASILGTFLFSSQVLNIRTRPNTNIKSGVGIKVFLFEYLPYYLLSGAIVISILYLIANLGVEQIR